VIRLQNISPASSVRPSPPQKIGGREHFIASDPGRWEPQLRHGNRPHHYTACVRCGRPINNSTSVGLTGRRGFELVGDVHRVADDTVARRSRADHTRHHRACTCIAHTRSQVLYGWHPCVRLPDLPYFTGDPVFQPRSPASRQEAARETESPVFEYRLIQIGRMTAFDCS